MERKREKLRLDRMAEGAGCTVSEYQELLRAQEQAGELTIVYMDDEEAEVILNDRLSEIFREMEEDDD